MITIKEAVKVIKSGGVVAFPTETVYGIGADATSQSACSKIYKFKQRPYHNPLIVHISSVEKVNIYAEFNENAQKLSKFWPGPLTMVLKKKEGSAIADCVTSGLSTIAIRNPAHKIAQYLIKHSACPIAAPSANQSGSLTSTTYEHVYKNFSCDNVPIIQDKNKENYGLESTIIDVSNKIPTILRLGAITPDMISKVLKQKVDISLHSSQVKAPGMLLKHYSPQTKIRLEANNLSYQEVGLNYGCSSLHCTGSMNLSVSGDLFEAASNLFSHLHVLDKYAIDHNIKAIAIAPIPNVSIGLAINDRLFRGAQNDIGSE